MKKGLAVLISVALGLLAAPAWAGTYDVWSCRLPSGGVAPLDGWHYQGPAAAPNGCPHAGFSASFDSSPINATRTVGWSFQAPQDLSVQSYELYRSVRVGAGFDGTSRAFALYHDLVTFDPLVYLFEFCATFAPCANIGTPFPADPMAAANRVQRDDLNAKLLVLQMECRALDGTRDCGPSDVGGGFMIARARITLNDALPPVIDSIASPLTSSGALLEGVQAVTVAARDKGSGVESVVIVVDGETVVQETLADQSPTCRRPFVKAVPCVESTTRTLAFDTATLPNGQHSIQIGVTDAGENRSLSQPIKVTTMNGATPNGVGASRRARITAAFVAPRRAAAPVRATIAYGERRAIRGRLTNDAGDPIGSAQLTITRQLLRPGAEPRGEGEITTRPDGTFRFRPVPGPSRTLRIEYRGFSLDAAPSATATTTLNVRAGMRLTVRPRKTTSHGTIRFAGKLLGGPGLRGVQVTLYAVGRKGRTRVPVSVLRTDAKGRFRFVYRFSRTFAPFTYRFQAQVRAQGGYPYATGGSRRVIVRVVQ